MANESEGSMGGWWGGLRGKLLILAFLALTPSFVVLVRAALEQRAAALKSAHSEALRSARLLALDQQRAFEETAAVLGIMARSPLLQTGTPEEVRNRLIGVLRANPRFANLGIVREDGTVRASAVALPEGVDLSDRTYFKRAIETGRLSLGEYQVGRITGKPSVNAALPMETEAGGTGEVLFVALDLARLNEEASRMVLPDSAFMAVLDHQGTVLVGFPEARDGVGNPLHESLARAEVFSGREGTAKGSDAAGTSRILGFAPLRAGGGSPVAYLLVGLDESALVGAANRVLANGLFWLGAVAVLAMGAAWFFGDLLVVRPVGRLEHATSRLAEGDLTVRIGPAYSTGDLGRLERAFDAMATSLQREQGERRASQEALRRSEELFRQMAETIEEVFWVSEPGEKPLKYASPAFERIFGFPPARLYEDHRLWVQAIHPSDRERVVASIARNEEAGSYDETYRVVRPDGKVRWVQDRAFPVRNPGGKIARIFGICEDITRSKDLEQEYHQAQKMEAVGRLAAGVAHDFNNLLTVIGGYTQLSMDKVSESVRGSLSEVLKASEQAAALTRQLLTFSRRQPLDPKYVRLEEVVAGVEKMIGRLVGAVVEVVRVPDRGSGTVHADPNQIRQVILNLVVNARDAMPEGGRLTIETYAVDVDEDYAASHLQTRAGPYAVLAVTDTGIGMDEKVRERIFEPFFTTKGEGKGTGLGLATVYGIVKQVGGDIFVYSEVGVGTTFKVYLPRKEQEAVRLPASATTRAPRMTPVTALVVEDDGALRGLLQGMLHDEGHTVLAAGSGPEALKVLRDHVDSLDLVITDVSLPGMNGFALASELRKVRPGVPVLFTSGYTEASQGTNLPDGSSYLAKPFNPADLMAKIRALLASTSQPRG